MLQVYNKYGQIKVVSSTSSSGVSSVSGVAPITSTGGSNPIISTLVTPNKLLGRYSASTGSMQEIVIGTGLSLVGNTLNSTSAVIANALTRVNDTNVTLTLGGTPATALLQNVSLTLGWSGTLADSRITSATDWNTAYTNRITSLTTTGSGAATLIANVLNIPTPPTATFTSLTVTGDNGASTLLSGVLNVPTYSLSGLGGQPLSTNLTSLSTLTYASLGFVKMSAAGTFALDTSTYLTTAVTSVGLTVPSAFSVTPSTITTSGTFAITGAGTASQYVRGDGTLANFPTSTGGGASVSYYLNGSVSQGTIGGVAYKEINGTPIIGTGTDFTINADGYIAQFITDVGDPNKLLIPAGNWNFETYFSASSGGGAPKFYIELYKYDGAAFTLIATNSATPENITGGTAIDLYFTALAIPPTTLLATDRLAVRFYVIHSGRTITMHTEDSHLSQIITTFSTGLTTLNGLTAQSQYFAVGTTGADFNISSTTDTHTFNLPDASATARGVITTGPQTIAGAKTFSSLLTMPSTGVARVLQVESSGQISGLDLLVYPSLAELETVKGITTGVTIQSQINGKQAYAIARTGAALEFDVPAIYNTYSSPSTAATLTDTLGTARIGVVQKFYSLRATEPAYPSLSYKKLGSGTYKASPIVNIIFFEYSEANRIEYWIVN